MHIHAYLQIYIYIYIYVLKQNLNRTPKYKVIALKKIKNTFFKDVTRRGPCVASLMKQNLNRT